MEGWVTTEKKKNEAVLFFLLFFGRKIQRHSEHCPVPRRIIKPRILALPLCPPPNLTVPLAACILFRPYKKNTIFVRIFCPPLTPPRPPFPCVVGRCIHRIAIATLLSVSTRPIRENGVFRRPDHRQPRALGDSNRGNTWRPVRRRRTTGGNRPESDIFPPCRRH